MEDFVNGFVLVRFEILYVNIGFSVVVVMVLVVIYDVFV